jgi:hypothetical protein
VITGVVALRLLASRLTIFGRGIPPPIKGRKAMKKSVAAVAALAAMSFSGVAFAEEPKTGPAPKTGGPDYIPGTVPDLGPIEKFHVPKDEK